jgi:hypothetical protein
VSNFLLLWHWRLVGEFPAPSFKPLPLRFWFLLFAYFPPCSNGYSILFYIFLTALGVCFDNKNYWLYTHIVYSYFVNEFLSEISRNFRVRERCLCGSRSLLVITFYSSCPLVEVFKVKIFFEYDCLYTHRKSFEVYSPNMSPYWVLNKQPARENNDFKNQRYQIVKKKQE